ncbi:hypothetical protein ACHAW6_010233 [Cyclotella cf. meneghiniana]
MKSIQSCSFYYSVLIPTLAFNLPTTDAFSSHQSLTRPSTKASPLTCPPHKESRHRRPISRRHFSKNDGGKESASLFEQTFKMKLPWETPTPQQPPPRKTRQAIEKEQVDDDPSSEPPSASKSKRRISRQNRQSYDLYGPPPMSNEEDKAGRNVDERLPSATATTKGVAAKQSVIHPTKRGDSPERKLGILLIDRGSKRPASNDALHSIADRYQTTLTERWNAQTSNGPPRPAVAVRAAHMELASPDVEAGLRSLLVRDGATDIVCVPFFLGGGRRVTVDVPNLIDGAREALEEEGLLDLPTGGTGRVQITTTRCLGSDVERMVEVVNDLVGEALLKEDDRDETFLWISTKRDTVAGGDSRDADHPRDTDDNGVVTNNNSLQNELQKYINRATLLENMLEKKVQQLRTMTNRVTILEDVLNKKFEENDKLARRKNENAVGSVALPNQEKGAGDNSKALANLTTTIDALVRERDEMANQAQILKTQTIDMANEYNKTLTELLEKISQLEGELKKQNETNTILLSEQGHQQNLTLERQQQKINDLQSQLADILDAYNELEQLQNETETSVIDFRNQLIEAKRENEQLDQCGHAKEEQYQLELKESQKLLEEEIKKSQNMLEASKEEYDRVLAQEKAAAKEWKDKLDALLAKQSERIEHSITSDARSEEEWAKMKRKLETASHALDDSRNKVHRLEKELEQQVENQESTKTAHQQQLAQQQQLQEYLQAQLQTYYETIQDQTAQISNYKKQIDEMQGKYNDSMLIATKSVEASQRRETDLLNNIEELESELKLLQKEKNDHDMKLKTLQERLNAVEMDNDLTQEKQELDQQNKQLAMEIDMLRREVDVVTGEKNAILMEKVKLERVLIDRVLGEDRKPEEILAKQESKQKNWRSYLWRPWTLLKRR